MNQIIKKSDEYIKLMDQLGYKVTIDFCDKVLVNGEPYHIFTRAAIRTSLRDLGYHGRELTAIWEAWIAHAYEELLKQSREVGDQS